MKVEISARGIIWPFVGGAISLGVVVNLRRFRGGSEPTQYESALKRSP